MHLINLITQAQQQVHPQPVYILHIIISAPRFKQYTPAHFDTVFYSYENGGCFTMWTK